MCHYSPLRSLLYSSTFSPSPSVLLLPLLLHKDTQHRPFSCCRHTTNKTTSQQYLYDIENTATAMTRLLNTVATLAVAGTISTVGGFAEAAPSAQHRITAFDSEDFVFDLGGSEPVVLDGFMAQVVNSNNLMALEGQGVSMVLFSLEACGVNLPHIHPRATEMLYVIEGNDIQVAFVEENGGEGSVVNYLSQGDVTFFPQGLIHYQQNLDCEPAQYLSALNSEDPGVVTIASRFFELPSEAIQASLNFDDPTLKAFLEALPEAPALARRECLSRCGLLDKDHE